MPALCAGRKHDEFEQGQSKAQSPYAITVSILVDRQSVSVAGKMLDPTSPNAAYPFVG
jgi:hypothetical protein